MEEKKIRRQSASILNPSLENIQPVKQTLDGDTDLGGAGGDTLENLSGPQQQQPFWVVKTGTDGGQFWLELDVRPIVTILHLFILQMGLKRIEIYRNM